MAVRLHCSMFFMPYNYILDIDLLENYKNILTGNIIIFDEAHNLPDAACQGQSCDFTNKVLMAALA